MLLALVFLLVDKLFARGDDLVLRLGVRGLRPARLGIRLAGATAAKPRDQPRLICKPVVKPSR